MLKGISIAYSLLTVVILGGIVFFFMVLRPQFAAIQDRSQQLQETRQELAQQEAFLSTIDQKLQQLQDNQQHEERLGIILPADERSEDYLRILHQISGTSGLTLGRLTNQSGDLQNQLNSRVARGTSSGLPSFIRPVGWEVNFSGTYQQFRAFLDELESAPRLVDVLQVSISRNQQDANLVTGRLTTQFYQYIPPSN